MNEVRNSKVKPSISVLLYDSSFWIYRYKIDLNNDKPLSKIFHEEIKGVDRTPGQTYSIIDNAGYYRFQYAARPVNSVSDIYFTISADSLETIKFNDSIIAYHCLMHNMSLKYEETQPIDIFVVEADSGFGAHTAIPSDILFVKRNSALYFLVMTPEDFRSSISANLLQSITIKE